MNFYYSVSTTNYYQKSPFLFGCKKITIYALRRGHCTLMSGHF